jgi:26S proteasome regulatory subunit N5
MNRLLLKQLVTMEVIQWTSLWEMYKTEFENEKNMLGGPLSEKAAEDLKLRIIEHVCFHVWVWVCRYDVCIQIPF